jgi:hypothetical protein
MKTQSDYQFDFTLFFNDKIICQRFFKCNNYNKNHIDFNNSVEIITSATDLIRDLLKSESIDLLWKNYNSNSEKIMFYKSPKSELLKININYNSKLVASSCIQTSVYPPKVRYNINIRPIIPVMISTIRFFLVNK